MSLEIERHWHREPGWLDELPATKRDELYAWWRVFATPTKKQTPPGGRGARARGQGRAPR